MGATGIWLGVCVAASAVGLAVPASGQATVAVPCVDTIVRGRVQAGDRFLAPFADGLVVRLDPEISQANPPGWTLRVTPTSDSLADYSFVATPPYRFWNARYLDTSYGVSPEAALAMARRDFHYVVTASDHEAAAAAVSVLLWPGELSDSAAAAARRLLDQLQTGLGTLWIEAGSTSEPSKEHPFGLIDWVRFRIELCTPENVE